MRIIGTSSRPRKDTLDSRNQARHGRLEEELNSDEVPRRGRRLPSPPDVVAEAGRPPPRASAQSGQNPPLFVCLFGPEGGVRVRWKREPTARRQTAISIP